MAREFDFEIDIWLTGIPIQYGGKCNGEIKQRNPLSTLPLQPLSLPLSTSKPPNPLAKSRAVRSIESCKGLTWSL